MPVSSEPDVNRTLLSDAIPLILSISLPRLANAFWKPSVPPCSDAAANLSITGRSSIAIGLDCNCLYASDIINSCCEPAANL